MTIIPSLLNITVLRLDYGKDEDEDTRHQRAAQKKIVKMTLSYSKESADSHIRVCHPHPIPPIHHN